MPFPDRAILSIDPYGPDMLVAGEFLEPQRGMIWVPRKQRESAPGGFPMTLAQMRVCPPKARPRAGFHKRPSSMGSSASLADSRKNAASLGAASGSLNLLSHASSCCWSNRKRAKSATARRFSIGNASHTRTISDVISLTS